MNKLSQNEHVIIFNDRSIRFITDSQYQNALKLRVSKQGFGIDGDYYNFNSISKVLTVKEYYDQYPDRRPVIKNVFKSLPEIPMTPSKRIRALSEMIRGFKQHFNGRLLPENSQKMLNKMEATLQKAKAGLTVNINPGNFF